MTSSAWINRGQAHVRGRRPRTCSTSSSSSSSCASAAAAAASSTGMSSSACTDSMLVWLVVGTASIVAAIAYLNSLDGDFVHDDLMAIKTNKDVTGADSNSLLDIFRDDFWGKPMADNTSHKSYRPLTILTFR
uniref:Uncharacterized protein n=1 Tax=Strigamia maritima TaxID=126957 RepID=T1J4S3_STRMM